MTPRPPVPRIGARRPVHNQPAPDRLPRSGSRGRRGSGGLTARPASRVRVAVVVVCALLLVLGGRLVQLQGLEATAYAAKAQAGRMRATTLPSVRGAVLDRWGHVLARDVDRRLVFGDPTAVVDPDGTAARVAPLIGLPADEVALRLRTPGTAYVVLAHLVDVPTANQIAALRLPGIASVRESQREHPVGPLAASLVGIVSADGHGASGVEGKLDAVLHGRDGSLREEMDPGGRTIPAGLRTETPAADGNAVRLTIDRDTQWAAQQALDAEVAASGARGGQVVVLDPRRGDVLALASAPGFDPRVPPTRGTPLGISALDTPYEPGSVNKVITAAAALESGVVTPATPFEIPPIYPVKGRGGPVHDAEEHGVEHLTFAGVLAKSSNIGTVQAAQQVGDQRLYAMLRGFGLGSRTGLGFAGESSGVLPDVAGWNIAQATTIPFGQGMSATGMQIASVYATVANGGVRAVPRLVRSTVAPDGRVTETPTEPGRRVITATTASTLGQMLEQVTTDSGTAPKAAIAGYRIAGKTGTAQAVDPNTGRYADGAFVTSFAGFAPADAPRLVVSVVIDRPTRGSHFGGDTAAPVFHQVMAFALRQYRIRPTGARPPVLDLCWGDRAGCAAAR